MNWIPRQDLWHTNIRMMSKLEALGRVKQLRWVVSSRSDLKSFPRAVRSEIGRALYAAQGGEADPSAKALRGFGGGSVLEIVAPYDGDTSRAVYTVRFDEAIYVLHAFQKEIKIGDRHT